MAGEEAWSGSDEGESISNWGVSHVDLAALGVVAGDRIRLRFEFGQDGCNGNLGWYVDDISVSHCAVGAAPSNADVDTALPSVSNSSRGGALGLGLLAMIGLAGLHRRR